MGSALSICLSNHEVDITNNKDYLPPCLFCDKRTEVKREHCFNCQECVQPVQVINHYTRFLKMKCYNCNETLYSHSI